MGFVINSLCSLDRIAGTFAENVCAYEVRLETDGSLRWVEHIGNEEVIYDTEPGMTSGTVRASRSCRCFLSNGYSDARFISSFIAIAVPC
jgi:hypothetical protein